LATTTATVHCAPLISTPMGALPVLHAQITAKSVTPPTHARFVGLLLETITASVQFVHPVSIQLAPPPALSAPLTVLLATLPLPADCARSDTET